MLDWIKQNPLMAAGIGVAGLIAGYALFNRPGATQTETVTQFIPGISGGGFSGGTDDSMVDPGLFPQPLPASPNDPDAEPTDPVIPTTAPNGLPDMLTVGTYNRMRKSMRRAADKFGASYLLSNYLGAVLRWVDGKYVLTAGTENFAGGSSGGGPGGGSPSSSPGGGGGGGGAPAGTGTA